LISDIKKVEHHVEPALFQKVLLSTDGTVTNLVSLYLNQTIVAKKISGTLVTHSCPDHLEKKPFDKILNRSVLLGVPSGPDYVYAESFFIFNCLSSSTQQQLMNSDSPIGLLWQREKFEMYREILIHEVETSQIVSSYLGVPPQTPLFSRTYLIHHRKRVIGQITEKFASTSFL
jgi:chorismate-pyruvate lyase